MNQITLKLAEQICQKKFEETFETKFNNNKLLINKSREDILKEQIFLWQKIGKTNLSENDIFKQSPINIALYYLCKEKIDFCTKKLFENSTN